MKEFLKISGSAIFWLWNMIFIVTVYLGILPYIGIPLVLAGFDGDIAVDFIITFFIFVTIPVAFIFIGYSYFRRQPTQLIRLFYGVEAPLFTWCLIRLFVVRELTLASGLLLGTLFVCIFIFAVELFEEKEGSLVIHPIVKLITHCLLLLMGFYLGGILLFYTIPAAIVVVNWIVGFIVGFFTFQWLQYISLNILSVLFFFGLFFILSVFSATLFVMMPFVVTTLYSSLGFKTIKEFARQYSKTMATLIVTVVIGGWISLLFFFNQQPQVQAFALVDKNSDNPQVLLNQSETLKKGLVNANLSPYRYLSPVKDNNHIDKMYRSFGFDDRITVSLQNTYNVLIAPFLFQGTNQDVSKSAEIYAQIFDTPLQKAERKAVRHAIKSTSIIDEAKAGLLNIDEKKVWLEKQEINIKPHGDWADVEIYEIYNNQTPDVEEIFYYFSLPESASITGLWLGESDKLDDRFAYQVSPRGAAQEVYNSQVTRNRPVDPALLEQVGVGQYRLRAFPVPPRLSSQDIGNIQQQRKMHLWLTYKVMKQAEGWALPKLAEKRNIYWTKWTKRLRNGNREWFFPDTWLENFYPDKDNSQPQSHEINLSNGYSINVKPLNNQDYVLPQQKKYALILDTSYSMNRHRQEVKETLTWWQNNLAKNEIDLYITNANSNQAQRLEMSNFDINKQMLYGSLQSQDLLKQFTQLKGEDNYQAILVITDGGSYELSDDKQDIPEINAPLWMIHLGGEYPRAYDDATLQAIQNSKGGVADNLATVMKRLATQENSQAMVVDGYSWQVLENKQNLSPSQTGFEPVIARQLVTYLSQNSPQKLTVAELDAIHEVAKNYGIVTPYSSMIVLVDDRQKEQLKIAESKDDRFDREVEKGFEDLNTPFNPLQQPEEVSGVPEPDNWILSIIVLLGLGLIYLQQKLRMISKE